jgi:hypothetical protein
MIKLESAPKQTTHVVSSHSGTPLGVGTCHGHLDTQDSPRPGLGGEATTFPLIVYSALAHGGSTRMAHFVGTPEMESRNCPEIVATGLPEL